MIKIKIIKNKNNRTKLADTKKVKTRLNMIPKYRSKLSVIQSSSLSSSQEAIF